MTAASVTIDAGVLAVPVNDSTADDGNHYVETVLDWSKLLDEPWIAICMSERASEALFEDGLYPLRDQLRRLFAAQGIIEYDVNTVAVVVDRLLQLTPSFEALFSIRDVLTENLALEPDVLCLCSGNKLRSELARCVVLIAILRDHCPQEAHEHSLILRKSESRILRVRAQIHCLEHSRTDLERLPIHPDIFEGEVLICEDFKGLVNCLDEATILLRTKDDVGMETAIRVALFKSRLASGLTPEWDDVPRHRIGRSFIAILDALHPTERLAAKVLRAIVETLERANMADAHAIRSGPGGGDPQRTRASDRAMRRDIDYEYHLHYWQCEDGTVEIASVVVHDDFSISE
ncbi:MAG: hypothetical protein JW720_08355 [Sedimentisphaerales bacterium]|nr:hypothetical protein [Sedimentisphaerales bacterium]